MRNSEGYYDPTAYEALSNIEREAKAVRVFRPIVYICSPLSGNLEENQEAARRYCRYAVDSGYIPIAPHIYFPQFMNDNNAKERNLAMFMEIEKAKCKGQPIRYFTAWCKEFTSV